MNKQRISNILSSIQMNPRDRKDFIDELSKLGADGQGGGEVSSEHPVRVIELTQEELMTGKELDITVDEYLKYFYIIKIISIGYKLEFTYKYSNMISETVNTYFEDFYILSSKNTYSPIKYSIAIEYKMNDLKNKISISPAAIIDIYGDVNFNLSTKNNDYNLQIISSIDSSKHYSVILFKDGSTIPGTYYNGTFTAFVEGKIKQYNVNQDTGAITESISIDISTLAGLEARIAALENA